MRIQKIVTKIIPRLRNKSYEERLNELNLFSLSKHRLRGELIEVFKIFNGFGSINVNDYVTTDLTSTTRNNGFKIIGKRFKSSEGKHFFFNRIVNIWNSLPTQIVNSNTIESFKKKTCWAFNICSLNWVFYSCVNYFLRSSNSRRILLSLTFLYKFHDSLSVLCLCLCSSCQLGLEGGVGEEEPSTLVSSCPYQVDIIVIV